MYSRGIPRELVLDTLLHLEYKTCFSYRGLRSRIEGKVEVGCVTDKWICSPEVVMNPCRVSAKACVAVEQQSLASYIPISNRP